MKGGVEIDPEKTKLAHFDEYCELCAWALALAHAKSGDAAMIAGYVGKSDELDEAMVRFAFAYADQTEIDHQALKAAAKSGKDSGGSGEYLTRTPSDGYNGSVDVIENGQSKMPQRLQDTKVHKGRYFPFAAFADLSFALFA